MKNNRILKIAAAMLIAAVITGIGLFRYQPQPVKAFAVQADRPVFGMVGITDGQTVRINVVNTVDPPEPDTPPDPCRVVMVMRDSVGNPFTRPNGTNVARTIQLNPGESAFLILNADNFPRASDGRIQLRPDVDIQQASGRPDALPPDPCIPTVEVINNANGRTQFLVNGYTGNHNESFVRDPSAR